eukprot:IDg21386t1
MTPERDCHGTTKRKAVMPKGQRCHVKGSDFETINRASLLACVSATGDAVLPLWIFKGKRLPYRVRTMPDGSERIDAAADILPPESLLATRPEVGGMDEHIFVQWCRAFVDRVKHLTANGRKVLLVYDGYRAHMTLRCLNILKDGNLEAYAIPAHTSGTTQPLDVTVFGPFKKAINDFLSRMSRRSLGRTEAASKVSLYDMCRAFTAAYNLAFSWANIVAGFEKTGLWPLSPDRLLSRSLPLSHDDIETVLEVPDLKKMLAEKRRGRRPGSSDGAVSTRAGYIDTRYGCLLTTETAMATTKSLENKRRTTKLLATHKRYAKELNAAKKYEAKKREKDGPPTHAMNARAERLGVSVDLFPLFAALSFVVQLQSLLWPHAGSGTSGEPRDS